MKGFPKTVIINKEVRIPNTDIILEKGDTIKIWDPIDYNDYYSQLEKLLPIDSRGVQAKFKTSSKETGWIDVSNNTFRKVFQDFFSKYPDKYVN